MAETPKTPTRASADHASEVADPDPVRRGEPAFKPVTGAASKSVASKDVPGIDAPPIKRRFSGDPASLPRPQPIPAPATPSASAVPDRPSAPTPTRLSPATAHARPAQGTTPGKKKKSDMRHAALTKRHSASRTDARRREAKLAGKARRNAPRRPAAARSNQHQVPQFRKPTGIMVGTVLAFVLPLLYLLREFGAGCALVWRFAGEIDSRIWKAVKVGIVAIDHAVMLCAALIMGALRGFFMWLPTRAGRGYCAFFGLVLMIAFLWVADEVRSSGLSSPAANATDAADTALFAGDNPILARLDGDLIRLSDVIRAARLSGRITSDETLSPGSEKTRQYLNDLIDQRLLARAAVENGITREPEVAAQLTMARERLLASAFLAREIARTVTPERVSALYNAQADITALGEEIRARHILVSTRAEAIEIITRIDRGADFSTLARARSLDRGTAPHGGDMGYFTRDMVSDEFARIAFTVEEGALSLPFRTDDGWNLVEVLDKRTTEPVSFNVVEEDLARFLELRTIDRILTELRETYEVVLISGNTSGPKD